MSFEIDAVCSDLCDQSYSFDASEPSSVHSHHETIFRQRKTAFSLASKSVQLLSGSTPGTKKTIKLCSVKGSEIKLGLDVKWGKSKQPDGIFWIEGKRYDDHGNSMQVKISQDVNGTGSLEVTGSHKTNN